MKRSQAITALVELLGDAIVVHANGMISRESFAAADRQGNFYMVGSMGLASSIALGIAIGRPDRQVVVLDGDGNVLMNLGALAMIGERRPPNLIHVVLDNEVYASTGGQRCISATVGLDAFARAAGYAQVQRLSEPEEPEELQGALQQLLQTTGPSFLHVKVEPGNLPEVPRVCHSPQEITHRVRAACLADRSGR